MYIQKPDYDISDFLEAIGFITPPGYDIRYFILPKNGSFNVPPNSGFTKTESIPEDESIIYRRTPPTLKKDFAQDPIEYSIWEPGELGRTQPSNPILPKVTDPSELESPFLKIHESLDKENIEFSLKENIEPFPSGTLFKARRIK